LIRIRSSDQIQIEGKRGVRITGEESRLEMSSVGVELEAETLSARVQRTRYDGEHVELSAEAISTRCSRWEQTVDRWIQRAKNIVQRVEELWHMRVKRANTEVQDSYRISAERASVTAREDVRIEGNRVYLG